VSGFSAEWLGQREAADHRARNRDLLAALARRYREREIVSVVDLGCGTGSNLRALSAALPARQQWRLVDHDPALLNAARDRIAAWADRVDEDGPGLQVTKEGRRLSVSFVQADLASEIDHALDGADLVTAAALFDLVSVEWIDRFVEALARRGAGFYTALTYNGEEVWAPPHPADAVVLAAFHAHQAGDKGFGASAGPGATRVLMDRLAAADYTLESGDSPWVLGEADAALSRELALGIVAAVRETGRVSAGVLSDWRASRMSGACCRVGHTDLLAFPRLPEAG
jgi:SAM-dependent methyltransferase